MKFLSENEVEIPIDGVYCIGDLSNTVNELEWFMFVNNDNLLSDCGTFAATELKGNKFEYLMKTQNVSCLYQSDSHSIGIIHESFVNSKENFFKIILKKGDVFQCNEDNIQIHRQNEILFSLEME